MSIEFKTTILPEIILKNRPGLHLSSPQNINVKEYLKKSGISFYEDYYVDCCWVVYRLDLENAEKFLMQTIQDPFRDQIDIFEIPQ